MIMGITIAEVISLPDETGEDLMVNYMNDLGEEALNSTQENIKLNFLQVALELMETVPFNRLPDRSGERLMETLIIEINGKTYTRELELVKALGTQPIYELRVDLDRPHWCFRATFFPKYHDNQLYYCFVHPFEKVAGLGDPTNHWRDQTYKVFHNVKFDFSGYAHYFDK